LPDVAIPSDRDTRQKEAEKKLKYKNVGTEIQPVWITKCFVTPGSIGVTGIVTKGLKMSVNKSIKPFDRPQEKLY
jgi:hypothetical protein